MDLIDDLEQTFDHAHDVIGNVRADQYDAPTPCPDWAVRDLLGHMIGVVANLGAAASGTQPTEFALGADPAAQFREAAGSALAAWRTPGVLDKVVDFGAGPMPGRAVAGINLLDTATHTWDVATSTGQPPTLPDRVAIAALEASRATISPEIRPGRFGAEVPAAPDAGPTEQLVAFLGRRP
jgi:uncharacterized protein (TIGR03086 family)